MASGKPYTDSKVWQVLDPHWRIAAGVSRRHALSLEDGRELVKRFGTDTALLDRAAAKLRVRRARSSWRAPGSRASD